MPASIAKEDYVVKNTYPPGGAGLDLEAFCQRIGRLLRNREQTECAASAARTPEPGRRTPQ